MHPALLALTLAAPVELFEERSLTDTAPLAEVITVRAVYHRREGDAALLPASVQGGARPVVHAFGRRDALEVTAGPRGWQCALPEGSRDAVRLVVTATRSPDAPALFRMRWPRVRPADVPVRRLVVVPRAWLDGAHPGWTCPDEPPDEVPCVSHEREPGALVTRVPAAPSSPASVTAASSLTTLALALTAWAPRRRAERVFAALGGLAVALAVGLSVVGARAASWGLALAVLLPVGALVGALAPRTRAGRVVGAASLLALPLLAVAGVAAPTVASLAALAAVATAGAALGDAR